MGRFITLTPRGLVGCALLMLTLGASSCRGDQSTGINDLPGTATSLADFEHRLDTLRVLLQLPGMSAAIGRNGQVVWTRPFGRADLAADKPVTVETTFHVASLTKLFGAVVLLRLVDSGLVGLDDPVGKYGITLASQGTIRVRHLLSMTSGDPTPGERFAYDGDRYALLGAVIQAASGEPFEKLAVDWLVRPLGLSRTAPNVDHAAFAYTNLDPVLYRAGLAKPYVLVNGRLELSAYPKQFSVSAGMISTPSDIVRLVQSLDSGTVLSTRMRDQMFTPARSSTGEILPYGFGCFSQVYRGIRVIWAYGYWTANSALMISVPERGLVFAVLANADRLSAGYRLGAGQLLDSPVAREFLDAFVFEETIRPSR
jgi:CubicO group peptidase (beta-lactamase class C family)